MSENAYAKNNLKPVYTLSKNEKFVNPYNFIEVDYTETKRFDITKESGEKLTGILECSLFPKVPFSIPDEGTEIEMKNEKGKSFKHNKYSFFNYDDVPIVPGSSLRGAIRNIYEAVSESCFSTSKNETLVTNRSTKAFKPGVLIKENNEWVLYEAKRLCVEKKFLKGLKYGDKVRILNKRNGKNNKIIVTELELFDENTNKEDDQGYLFVGEPFPNVKRYESIFCTTKKYSTNKSVIEESVKRLDNIYKAYYDNNVKSDKEHIPYEEYEKAVKRGVIPIWYSTEYGGLKFSLACLGRYSYDKNMGKILGEKASCKTKNNICKACALFGMASNENVGSRIRITDAVLYSDKDSYEKKYFTLKPLGSPKISYLPFYLKKPDDVKNWSYDNTDIRGRKFYWHSDKIQESDVPSAVNATVEIMYPKKDSLEFKFNVYYDGITKKQLDELIWTLTLGDNRKDSTLCYKIGHGKPLGLGSAKIVINNKRQRSISDCYKMTNETVPQKLDIPLTLNKYTAENILMAMDMNTTKDENVSYPYIKPAEGFTVIGKTDDTSMKWFSENFKLGKNFVPRQYLPETNIYNKSKDLEAYVLTYIEKKNNNKDKNDKGNKNAGQNIDKNKIYEAVIINADCDYPLIKLENGEIGSIFKQPGLKKDGKIKVKFRKVLNNGKISYKYLGTVQ